MDQTEMHLNDIRHRQKSGRFTCISKLLVPLKIRRMKTPCLFSSFQFKCLCCHEKKKLDITYSMLLKMCQKMNDSKMF